MSKRSETSKQVPDAQLVSDSEPTKLDGLDGGEIENNCHRSERRVFSPEVQRSSVLAIRTNSLGEPIANYVVFYFSKSKNSASLKTLMPSSAALVALEPASVP